MVRDEFASGLSKLATLLVGLVFVLLSAAPVSAQQVSATLFGTVTDPAGAAIPEATVTALNPATGVAVSVTTQTDGTYVIPSLRPADYTITVEKTGFDKSQQTRVTLVVNQQSRLDVQLKVGTVSTVIEITSAAPLVETGTATVGLTVDTNTITELPLNIRRFGALGLLMPGTVPDRGGFANTVFGSPFSETTYASNGARSSGNNVLIDGVDSQNLFSGGFSVQPSPDAVQEFSFQTESFSAAFGKRAGSTLNLVTRSGGNEIHGSAFEFLRNDKLDARNFFNINQTNPVTGAEIPGSARPEYRRNQFGGYVGGPIIKNKMFVFGGYEALRERKGLTGVDTIPTPQMLRGDFSQLLDPSNPFGVTPIIDPTTCAPPPAASGTGCTAFKGNIIPANRIDPVALKVISYNAWPAANAPGLQNNYVATPVRRRGDNQYLIKYDYNINDKDKLFVRFIRATSTTFTTEPSYSNLPGFGDKIPFYGTNVAIGWTHTFSPTLLNEVRLGFSRNQDVGVCSSCPRAPGFMASFGIQGFGGGTFHALSPSQEGFPAFEFSNGYTTVGDSNYRPVESNDMVEKYYDALTWIKGKHTITTGVDLDPYQSFRDQAPVSPHGQFYYQNLYSGFGISDFMLGYPSLAGSSIRDAVNEHLGGFYAAFFQDDIRATNKLTINVGVRWEHHRFPIDKGNVGAALFRIPGAPLETPGNAVLVMPSPVADSYCNLPLYINAQGDHLVMCTSDMKKYGFTGRAARSLAFGDNFNWAPRIGFAWRPTASDKFVVRAGYGMFFDFPDFNIFHYGFNNPIQGATYLQSFPTGVQKFPNGSVGPPAYTDTVFANAGAVPLSESFASINVDPHFRQSYIHEWDLDIESQLTPSLALDTRYLGTSAIEMTHFHCYGNQAIPGPGNPQARRLYPDFGNTCEGGPGANANYNSLQVQLTKRMSQGLSFLAGYTWAHQLTSNEGEEGGYADGGSGLGQNDNAPGQEYGNGVNDVRSRFTWGGTYELPFGPGKRFATGTGGVLNTLIGGWEVAPNFEWQSGFYWTPLSGFDYGNVLNGAFRPDRICGGNLSGGQRSRTNWFDRTCFTDNLLAADNNNGVYRFGNSGRSIIGGPGIFNLDFGLYKTFKLSEQFKLQFRGEFFNGLNHTNFGGPDMNVKDGTNMGVISSTNGDNREIQFALKVLF